MTSDGGAGRLGHMPETPPSTGRALDLPPPWAAPATVVFTLLFPGTVVGLVPWWLSGFAIGPPLFGSEFSRIAGIGLIAAGLVGLTRFLVRFVREGHGTPAPILPPSRLVVGGVFRHSRNPGYVAVVSILLGETLALPSTAVLGWAACVAAGFHLFGVLYEEPDLRPRFGPAYEEDCRTVPRWLPRLGRRPRP